MATVKLISAFFLSLFQILSPVAALVVNFGESAFFTEWSVTDNFTADYCAEIEKNPDEDFVILNLADIQLKDDLVYEEQGEKTKEMIDNLIKETNPDLITLTGDNAWGTIAYIKLIHQIDSYGIPWAPVMGNHDGQCLISEFWAAHLLYKAENCLFEFGPENMGYGNYIINITENGRNIHTLFMVDTHNNAEFILEDGSTVSGYDHLWNNQIEWYKWAVNGTTQENGATVDSTVIYHIPNVEYYNAWNASYDYWAQDFRPEFEGAFGYNMEGISSAPVNNGFFDVVKEMGSTKHIICGHNHRNYSSIPYEGVWLHYAVKTGVGSYYEKEVNGGKVFTLSSDGTLSAENILVDIDQFGIDYSIPYPGYSE